MYNGINNLKKYNKYTFTQLEQKIKIKNISHKMM
jgi:hypothetical protein